jgi:hypothetical protein
MRGWRGFPFSLALFFPINQCDIYWSSDVTSIRQVRNVIRCETVAGLELLLRIKTMYVNLGIITFAYSDDPGCCSNRPYVPISR